MKVLCTLLVSIFFFTSGFAQSNYILDKQQSAVTIQGTSTVHDWESIVENFSVDAQVSVEEDQAPNIQSFSFTAQVNSIESGKRIMNRKTMGALNEKDYPQITFSLTGIETMDADSITATGLLSIAGQEQPISVTAAYTMDNNALQLVGAKPILMSNFGIDPPTAMMGTMKTGDEVTIDFKLYLTKQ